MGSSFSSMFGVTNEPSDEYLQLTDLGGFLSKYIFIMLDKEKKKMVSKQEYLTLVNHFREEKMSEEELDNFLKKSLERGKSTDFIDESVFKKLVVQLAIDFDQNIVERMKYLMTLFDKDGDGFVSDSDLLAVYDVIGIQVPLDPIKSLVGKYDVDGDGRLSEAEFEQLGRAAMNKLFFKRENTSPPDPPAQEDILVDEAIRKAALTPRIDKATKKSSSGEDFKGINENELSTSEDPHVLNNNLVEDCPSGLLLIDNLVLGKPVEIKDSGSTSSSLVVERASFANPYEYFEPEEREGDEDIKGSGDSVETQIANDAAQTASNA